MKRPSIGPRSTVLPSLAVLLFGLLISVSGAWPPTAGAAEVQPTVVVAKTGDPIPGGSDVIAGLEVPVLQGGGRAAFIVEISDGALVQGRAVFRGGPAAGELVEIVRDGDALVDGNGNVDALNNSPLLTNRAGEVACLALFENTLGFFDAVGILIGDGTAPPRIVARGEQIPPGASGFFVTFFDPAALDARGRVAFTASLSDGSIGVFRGDGTPGNLVTLALSGQTLPSGDVLAAAGAPFVPAMNASGAVAFRVQTQLPGDYEALYRGDGAGPLVEIVRGGAATPSGDGQFEEYFLNFGPVDPDSFNQPLAPINDRGEVAFAALLQNTSGDVTNNQGLYLGDGSSLVELVRKGDPVPDGNGSFLALGPRLDLDNAGNVLFYAAVSGASGGATDGLFLADRTSVRQIVRRADPAPGGGIFADFFHPSGLSDRAGGVFRAFADLGDGGTTNDVDGLYFFDGASVRAIAREGDTVAGLGTIVDFRLAGREGVNQGIESNALGDLGQVAFHFTSGGSFRIAVWSGVSVFADGFESGSLAGWALESP